MSEDFFLECGVAANREGTKVSGHLKLACGAAGPRVAYSMDIVRFKVSALRLSKAFEVNYKENLKLDTVLNWYGNRICQTAVTKPGE